MLTLKSPAPQDETLPTGWARTTLGELGTIYSGSTPRTSNSTNFDGGIPWITPADLSGYTAKFIAAGRRSISERGLASSGATLMPAGTVLFSSRAPVGYVAIASGPVSTNQGFKSLYVCAGVFNEYVYYYLKASKGLAESFASGTTFLEISGANFGRLPIPLPPLPEQRRIVAKLEELFTRLDAGVSALHKSRRLLARLRAATVHAATTGALTRDTSDTTGADSDLPAGWTRLSLGELSWDAGYGTSSKCAYVFTGTPVLRIPNVSRGRLDLSDLKFAGTELDTSDALAPGDLLVIRTNGSRDLIGRAAVVAEAFDRPHFFASYLIRFRLTGGPRLAAWVAAIWHSPLVRRWIEERAATSAGQYNISMGVLRELPIPLPPEDEQQAIVTELERRLSIIDALEVTLTANLKRAERLRQSILQRAFSGRLVPQDPTDEPASELLHRIQLEKAARHAAGTGRRRGRPRKLADQEAIL